MNISRSTLQKSTPSNQHSIDQQSFVNQNSRFVNQNLTNGRLSYLDQNSNLINQNNLSFDKIFDLFSQQSFNSTFTDDFDLPYQNTIKTINDIPYEIIEIIIKKYFALYEMINLRFVSYQFKQVIDNLLIKEIIILNQHNLDQLNNSWTFTSRELDHKNCLSLCLNSKFFQNPFFNFKCLKSIKIMSTISSSNFRFTDLNEFNQLEELDVNLVCFKKDKEILNSINLKYLSISTSSPIAINCNTPKLLKFSFNQFLTDVEFKDYNSIKQLNVVHYEKKIEKFVNLNILNLIRAYQIDCKILDHLKNLKELNLFSSYGDNYSIGSFSSIVKNKIESLLKEIRSKNLSTKIYLFGIHMETEYYLNEMNFYLAPTVLFLNYKNLNNNLNWFKRIDFNSRLFSKLMLPLDHNLNLPDNFFTIFNNIQQLNVTGKALEPEILTKLISNSKNLKSIKFTNIQLGKSFYKNVVNNCPNINQLEIMETRPIGLDIDHLINLKLLIYFNTNQDLQMKSVLNLIENLNFFQKIIFKHKGDRIQITKLFKNFTIDFNEKNNIQANLKNVRMPFKKLKEELSNLN